MNNKENVILIDYDAPYDWEFHKAIEETTGKKWTVYKEISNENHSNAIQKFIRYAKYFIVPLKIAKRYKRYNKVLAWQQFYGLILAFYFRVFNVQNTPDIVVLTFIYKPKRSIAGKIYDKFIRYIVTSKYIKHIVVFSESEKIRYAEYFGVPKSKFTSEILGYEDKTLEIPMENAGDFYLAAGRSNRDYKFLIDAWNNRKELLTIVCDTLSSKDTPHIRILNECHDDAYFAELAKCYAAVVPLEDMHISSGQLVIIQAMMYGKPVVVTENDTVKDYIVNGKTGLIIEKTEKALEDAIELLKDETYYKQMSIAARKQYESKFSIYAMGVAIGMLLN